MATTAPTPVSGKATPLLHTTRRGLSTASFCLGLWGFATFWMYPFGFFLCNIAIGLALTSIVMGFRSGEKGQQLAWWGLLFGASGAGAAVTIFRFYQLAYEGSIPTML
ncbi:MAG: hypothetical protein ACRC8S_19675 [Fimbriiglobus sp.]